MRIFIVFALITLAWYGHGHDWGFWAYALVFFAGVGVGMGDEGVEDWDELISNRPPVLGQEWGSEIVNDLGRDHTV